MSYCLLFNSVFSLARLKGCQLILEFRWCSKALNGMVIVRSCGREVALASGTCTSTRAGNSRDPPITVLAPDMNEQICLHLGCVITARAGPCRCCIRWGVCLQHVLRKPTLLNKPLRTHAADMLHLSSVLLHVVEHSILSCLCDPTIWAYKFALLIAKVRHSLHSGSINRGRCVNIGHPVGRLPRPVTPSTFGGCAHRKPPRSV